MEVEKYGVLGKHGAVQVLDYCQNNNDFKLTADDVKQLAMHRVLSITIVSFKFIIN